MTPPQIPMAAQRGYAPDEFAGVVAFLAACRLVSVHGEGNWSCIARALNTQQGKDTDSGRIGKQVR